MSIQATGSSPMAVHENPTAQNPVESQGNPPAPKEPRVEQKIAHECEMLKRNETPEMTQGRIRRLAQLWDEATQPVKRKYIPETNAEKNSEPAFTS